MQLVYDRLVANGIDRVVVLDPMHDMDAARETARRLKQAGVDEVVGALTFTISAVHDDAFYADLARQMRRLPGHRPGLRQGPGGDPHRRAGPHAAAGDQGGARRRRPLELHSHATIGLSPLTYSIAPELGVEVVQTGCGALGNGSSLPEARRTVANLREMGHRVDIDDRALGLACDFFDRLAAAEELPVGRPQDFDAAFLHHQIAGGVHDHDPAAAARDRHGGPLREPDRGGRPGPRRAGLPDHGDAVPADGRLPGAVQRHRASGTRTCPTR